MKPTLEDLRLVDRVRKAISRGPLFWYVPSEIIAEFNAEDRAEGKFVGYSDASITARCRDLRKPEFGGFTVNQRRRAGSRAHEYQLELPAEQVKAA